MRIEGSCACGAVDFSTTSPAPSPYRICYCSRCRKTAGGVGAAINILADADTLEITGEEIVTSYRQGDEGPTVKFCSRCGSALWIELPGWPEWVYPFASAVDSALPVPPHYIHIQVRDRPAWIPGIGSPDDPTFEANTEESIIEWHQRMGMAEST